MMTLCRIRKITWCCRLVLVLSMRQDYLCLHHNLGPDLHLSGALDNLDLGMHCGYIIFKC